MKTINEFISNSLKEHAMLVSAGMNSVDAINLIAFPIEIRNLKEYLEGLTIDQVDALVLLLRRGIHGVKGKKATYYISGVLSSPTGLKIALTDNAMGIDSIELYLEELTETMKSEILKGIREVL